MKRQRNYFIGVRGKLVLSLLVLVVLAMWLLGLSLMQLTRSALTSQLSARGDTMTTALEHVIAVAQAQHLYGSTPGTASPRHIKALLYSMARDPEVEAMTIYDSSGRKIAGVRTQGTEGDPLSKARPFTFTRPLSFGSGEKGSIEISFSRHLLRRQLAIAILRIVVQLAVSALVLIVFINILVSLTVLSPVRKLLRATERIGSGDLSHSVDTGGRDEFGDLASSFNTMQQKLRESEQQIRQQLESLRQAHKDLQGKEEQLVQSEKMAAVGRVASGVAHEVGNPLGSVTGYLAMLCDESLSVEEKREYLTRAEKELGRINRIMLDLLNYARPPRLEWSDLDLNAIIRDVHHTLSSQPEFGETTLSLELQEELPALRGDLHRLQQLLVNIVLNASQAMPEGGLVVLRSFVDPDSGGRAGFSIADQGPGIPDEDLPHIFEPFFTTRKGERGSGLGLALCRQIASSMGASMEVDSRPGVGSTFTVLFPVPGDRGGGGGKDG